MQKIPLESPLESSFPPNIIGMITETLVHEGDTKSIASMRCVNRYWQQHVNLNITKATLITSLASSILQKRISMFEYRFKNIEHLDIKIAAWYAQNFIEHLSYFSKIPSLRLKVCDESDDGMIFNAICELLERSECNSKRELFLTYLSGSSIRRIFTKYPALIKSIKYVFMSSIHMPSQFPVEFDFSECDLKVFATPFELHPPSICIKGLKTRHLIFSSERHMLMVPHDSRYTQIYTIVVPGISSHMMLTDDSFNLMNKHAEVRLDLYDIAYTKFNMDLKARCAQINRLNINVCTSWRYHNTIFDVLDEKISYLLKTLNGVNSIKLTSCISISTSQWGSSVKSYDQNHVLEFVISKIIELRPMTLYLPCNYYILHAVYLSQKKTDCLKWIKFIIRRRNHTEQIELLGELEKRLGDKIAKPFDRVIEDDIEASVGL